MDQNQSKITKHLIPRVLIYPNPWQTRKEFDTIGDPELAQDIAENGLLQAPAGRLVDTSARPVSVVVSTEEKYLEQIQIHHLTVQLAFGHRRLAACNRLARENPGTWAFIPVEIAEFSDQQMALLAWAENAQRADLSAIEKAEAIQRMIVQFGWTQEQAAEHLHMGRSTVANTLRLLNLPDAVQRTLRDGTISERQAMAILPARDFLTGQSLTPVMVDDALATDGEVHKLITSAVHLTDERPVSPQSVGTLVEMAKRGASSDTLRAQAKTLAPKKSALEKHEARLTREQSVQRTILVPAARIVERALYENQVGAWREMGERVFVLTVNATERAENVDEIRAKIARQMVRWHVEYRKTDEQIRADVTRWLGDMGLSADLDELSGHVSPEEGEQIKTQWQPGMEEPA
jgi:ParB/RepB/Spo0J family partition protein